ncbi:sigma-70 family RNA polymerase sigma factor [Thomasclavelia cocleata]|jgi:RNA polymerase sigma factor, sigma-70 family|uniref:sigma-70 family RNA polymerase sigma factor n=1 Tax=Thomasclavelia cocleata TaxID=69824 RepID=UPI00256F2BFF|nr:sigma-70 family RNA polymerase sigma factor [Thomasclavelia cocleata]
MDKALIEQKFNENMNLIHFVINNFVQNKENLTGLCTREDLFQVGSMALCHAITTYNEKTGAFSTYATNVIKNRIYNALRDSKDRILDSSANIDDDDSDFIESNISLRYNEYEKVEDELFEINQKEVLYNIAKRYSGISQKGVIAIQLMTQGYSCKAIAKVFDTDEKNLTAWISRARTKLKNEPEILRLVGKEDFNE